MADLKATALSALSPILTTDLFYAVSDPGGTPASKKVTLATVMAALQTAKAFDLLAPLTAAEIAITGATTATIGRWHYCTGTSADYTLTLPAVSGNQGKFLGVRMAPLAALSKLVTLDGASTETVDSALTRLMWAQEVAFLLCDEADGNWIKIAGKSIPMTCYMTMGSAQSVNSSSVTALNTDTSVVDNTGLMADTGNKRITIKRTGYYSGVAMVYWDPFVAYYTQLYAANNNVGTLSTQPDIFQIFQASGNPTYSARNTPYPARLCTVGDLHTANVYQNSGSPAQANAGAISATEHPTW